MESLIKTFHLDLKLMIAQLVNFAIVALILWYFALKPLTKIMKERTAKIEKGLQDAKMAQEKLAKIEIERKESLNLAKKESAEILEQASKVAEINKKEMVGQAKEEIEKLLAKGKMQLQADQEQMVEEAKAQIGELVIESTRKVLGQALTKEIDKKIIKETIKEIK